MKDKTVRKESEFLQQEFWDQAETSPPNRWRILDQEYNLESSSENALLITSLLSLRAAVTSPDSGVHGSGSNLIFTGISNFSRRALFAAC